MNVRLARYALTQGRYTRHLRRRILRSILQVALCIGLSMLVLIPLTWMAQWGLADWHYVRGNEYLEAGRWDAAIREFEAALSSSPNHVQALNNLGYAYFQKGQVDFASEYWQTSASLAPSSVAARNNLGMATGVG